MKKSPILLLVMHTVGLCVYSGNILPAQEAAPSEDVTVVNATGKFRILVRYTNVKDQTSIDPIAIGSTIIIKRKSGTPIFYSVGDISDHLFSATPDLFFGSVLTIKIPQEMQDMITRTTLTTITSSGEAVAEKVIAPRPYTPPLPKQNEVIHQPLVVPPPPAEGIHYTYPGMGIQTR